MAGYNFTPAPGPAPTAPAPAAGKYTFTPDVLSAPDSGVSGSAVSNLNSGVPPIEDPSKLPYSMDQIAASLPTDPDAKIKYLAKAIFPNRNLTDALSSMGWQNGRVFYVAPDNKAYYAEPSFDLTSPLRTFKETPSILASGVGPSLSTIGGIGGGLATPEIAGGVPGAAAGGAIGDALRQGAAKVFTGETKSPLDRLLQTGAAAAEQGIGQLGGHLLAGGASHLLLNAGNVNPLKVSAFDVGSLSPGAVAQGQYWSDLGQKYGIPVTPGEATGSRSLLANQRQLLRYPESAQPFGAFLDNRSQNLLPQSWETNLLDKVSAPQAPAVGGQQFGQGAQAAIDKAVDIRRGIDKPNYDAIMSADNTMPQDEHNLLITSNPAYATALKEVRASKYLGPALYGAPDNSLPVWDAVKKQLDFTAAETNPRGLSTLDSHIANGALSNLVPQLDAAFPGYAAARAGHAGASPAVDQLTQGITGIVAKNAERATNAQGIPDVMFGPRTSNPIAIAQAKSAYAEAGQMPQWNAGVRTYLDGLMNQAQTTMTPGANLWKTLGANKYAMANLKAAMEPRHYQALDDLMNIAEMLKRAPAEGSPTITDLGARGNFASGTSKILGKFIGNINPAEFLRNVEGAIQNASAGKGLSQMVDMITQDPQAVQALKSLRTLTPGQLKFTQKLGYLGTVMLANGVMNPSQPDQFPAR